MRITLSILLSLIVSFALGQNEQTNKVELKSSDYPVLNFKHPKSRYTGENDIWFKQDFKSEGKYWTMYFRDLTKSVTEYKVVREIWFVPEDYCKDEKIESAEVYGDRQPPKFVHLIYHDIGENEFVGALVVERFKDYQDEDEEIYYISKEIKLPDEVANNITGLLLDKTQLKAPNSLKSFSVTKSPKLLGKKRFSNTNQNKILKEYGIENPNMLK